MLNTPSHHRVHHGANEQYLDRNYGGILIIWDRLFGTFEPEGERVRYGLTTNIETFNPVRVAFHEYAALGRDLRAAGSGGRWNLLCAGPVQAADEPRSPSRTRCAERAEFEPVMRPDGEWAGFFRATGTSRRRSSDRRGEYLVTDPALARARALPRAQRARCEAMSRAHAALLSERAAYLSRRESRRSLSTRPSVWSRGQ